jgi:hypothetical protein
MLYLSKTSFVYRFYKILVIAPTTEVKAESIGAPSVKEIANEEGMVTGTGMRTMNGKKYLFGMLWIFSLNSIKFTYVLHIHGHVINKTEA